jgi:hypothetical protein
MGAALRRLLVIAAVGAALVGLSAPSFTTAKATACDYSASVPAADAERDRGKAAVRPLARDLKTLAKKRISDPVPPAATLLTVATAEGPVPHARPLPDEPAFDPPARRSVAAQPRAPPTIRS